MKKIILCLIMLFVVCLAFSQETTSSVPKIRLLIEDNLFKNADIIAAESVNLTDTETYTLYTENEKEMWTPLLLNGFLGFGIGSFSQGDYLGGGIAVGAELVGYGLLIAGVAPIMNLYFNPSTDPVDVNAITTQYVGFYLAGTAVLLGNRIFQVIRPVVYTNSFNDTLKKSLGVTQISYSATPAYDFKNEEPTLTLAFNIQF